MTPMWTATIDWLARSLSFFLSSSLALLKVNQIWRTQNTKKSCFLLQEMMNLERAFGSIQIDVWISQLLSKSCQALMQKNWYLMIAITILYFTLKHVATYSTTLLYSKNMTSDRGNVTKAAFWFDVESHENIFNKPSTVGSSSHKLDHLLKTK